MLGSWCLLKRSNLYLCDYALKARPNIGKLLTSRYNIQKPKGGVMADASSSIFNKKAAERLRSPDDLDKFVRVTNPSVWVVLAACVALLAGLLAWGVFGAVTTNVTSMGVVIDGQAMCFLSAEDVSKVDVGDAASIDGTSMTVSKVASVPLSRGEANIALSSDYLTDALVKNDWAYQVTFEGDTSGLVQNVPLSASITVERMAPLSLIMRGNK